MPGRDGIYICLRSHVWVVFLPTMVLRLETKKMVSTRTKILKTVLIKLWASMSAI